MTDDLLIEVFESRARKGQVGNAVPPLLAGQIASIVGDVLEPSGTATEEGEC
jgi:hypothetical protein